MVNYENGIIYKLCCKNLDVTDIYIGSTTSFRKRKCRHKSDCNNINSRKYNLYVYKFIRENGGFENWDMIEIEKYKAKDKRDLEKRERYFYEQMHPKLNSMKPFVILEESKERAKEYNKKYYEENREKINENNKKYYEENREKINENIKKYYENNKEKIKENRKIQIKCECGSTIRKDGLERHKKTKKHINYLNSISI